MTSPQKFQTADAVFLFALVLVAGLCAYTGIAMPLGSFPEDTFFLLGNAYRVAGGQIPHVDFSSPWGPVIFLIEAAGLRLSGMHPSALGYANAVFGPAIAVWAFLAARVRWPAAVACVIGAYTLLLIVAPFPLGNNPMDFSYAMVYNRYAYALLGIVLLECTPGAFAADSRVRQSVALAVSTGVALALLAYLKASYAVLGIAFVVLFWIAGGARDAKRFFGIVAGFAGVLFLGLCYLRFDVADVLRDLTMAAGSRALALEPSALFGIANLENAALVALAFLVARYRGLFAALVTIAAGCVVLITNQQVGEFPLDAYVAVALVAGRVATPGTFAAWPAGIALLTAACVLPVCEGSAISLVSAAFARRAPMPPGAIALAIPERGATLTFAAFRGRKNAESELTGYIAELNDGSALLRGHIEKRQGVLLFEEFNAFNYMLGLPTPRGGFAAAAYDYIFDDADHPSPERFFGDASYVMVPNGNDYNTAALLRLYGRVLRMQFAVVARTPHWVLWRRKQALQNASAAGQVLPRLKTTE